jgi:hypothetical protein
MAKKILNVNQPNGFTVVQALVVGALVLILGSAFMANQSYLQKSQSRMAAGVARGALMDLLYSNAASPLMIYRSSLPGSSVTENSPLGSCICGESPCQPNHNVAFDLLDSEGRILAGESSTKMKYNALAEFCDGGGACSFEAASHFTCVGSNCGTQNVVSGNPVLKISYHLKLTSFALAHRKEYAYLKELERSPTISVAEIKSYGMKNDLCVTSSGFSPVYGLSSGGTTVTITGTGFQRVTSVLFDNSPCSIVSRTNKSLQCVNPPHPDGAVQITLVYGKERYKLASTFLYYTPPPPPPPPPDPEPDAVMGKWKKDGDPFVIGPCCNLPKTCVVGETATAYHGGYSFTCQ